MTNKHYILSGHEVISVPMLEWAHWFEEASKTKSRVLKQETLPNGKWVSTVFLGLDHNFSDKGPPLLFETMVFTTKMGHIKDDLDMDRYSTWDEAMIGHLQYVTKWSKK